MKTDDESPGAGDVALSEQKAELTAYRTILQNLLLEVARETGAERLNAIREASLGDVALLENHGELLRCQTAAIVHQCFDTVAAAAGFAIRNNMRNAH
jgi:hypothetical protein